MTTRGFVLGKFLPPHAGHLTMCRMAAALVGELTVLVCTLDREPIPGWLRAAWMRELLPGARIVHYDQEVPQEPAEHPDFWPIWRKIIGEIHPEPVDFVFGSEPYIARLAQELGARPVPVDPDRRAFPVSGQAIRQNPAAHWRHIPAPVRPWYQKRVVTFGAESTGKSVMAEALAQWLGGPAVPEMGRTYEDVRTQGDWQAAHLIELASRHEAHRAAIAPEAGPVLAEDTDPLLTSVWARMLLGAPVPWLEARPKADLYLLMDANVPFVQDGGRYFATDTARTQFQALCVEALDRTGVRVERVTGDWNAREAQARAAVERLMAEPFPGLWERPDSEWPVHTARPQPMPRASAEASRLLDRGSG
ncbi:MAG: AAA family ATPase [Paracoccaceae bacterium]|nr:AAA family ATPase [Paracoccaceae bacterium]